MTTKTKTAATNGDHATEAAKAPTNHLPATPATSAPMANAFAEYRNVRKAIAVLGIAHDAFQRLNELPTEMTPAAPLNEIIRENVHAIETLLLLVPERPATPEIEWEKMPRSKFLPVVAAIACAALFEASDLLQTAVYDDDPDEDWAIESRRMSGLYELVHRLTLDADDYGIFDAPEQVHRAAVRRLVRGVR